VFETRLRCRSFAHVHPFEAPLEAPFRNDVGLVCESKFQKEELGVDGTRGPFQLGSYGSPPFNNEPVQKRIDSSYNPLSSLVARKPAVLLAETLDRAGLEQTKNVARELRPNAAFGAQTSNANDGPQRAAEVALFVRSRER
jgi:hypothetical protein